VGRDKAAASIGIEGLQDRFRNNTYFDILGLAADERSTGAADPLFSNELLDFWSPLGMLSPAEGGYEVGLCRIKEPLVEFDRMERHTGSVEIIVPLDDLFIPAAPPGDEIRTEQIRIIPVRKGEIIQLHAGVWHFACGPLGSTPLDYLVFLKGDAPKKDLEMKELGFRILIER
jgi:hypothetical protein